MEIQNKVFSIITEQLGIKEVKLEGMLKSLGADSLDEVEIVMALEEEFGIEIPDEDIMKFRTVEDVVKYINEKKG